MSMFNQVYIGDVLDFAALLPPQSVQTIVTSPPYFGLRDYGTGRWEGGDPDCDHKKVSDPAFAVATSSLVGGKKSTGHLQEGFKQACGKCGALRIDKQIGMEPTPAAFVATLVAVFRALAPALKDDGTLWLNLGDSYSGGGGFWAGAPSNQAGALSSKRGDNGSGTTAYKGRQPTPGLKPKDMIGIPWRVALALQEDGWYLRSDIVWHKPNPMPESVTDRPTRSHEYIFLLTKSARYFYDHEAIAEPASRPEGSGNRYPYQVANERDGENANLGGSLHKVGPRLTRNKRDVWTVPTSPYPESHYATFPPELIRPCILAGSRVGDVVCDPFGGSGTTAMVAVQERRQWVACDLDARSVGWTAARLAGAQTRLGLEGVA